MEIRSKGMMWVCFSFVYLLIYIVIFFLIRFPEWKRELWYINMELQRAEGKNKRLWEKRKKRLYLSLIPFVKLKRY